MEINKIVKVKPYWADKFQLPENEGRIVKQDRCPVLLRIKRVLLEFSEGDRSWIDVDLLEI